jgi:hypothetical protein
MNDEPLQHDLEVFGHYGRAMAAVQQFELPMTLLARLINPDLPEDVPYERAWRRIRRRRITT